MNEQDYEVLKRYPEIAVGKYAVVRDGFQCVSVTKIRSRRPRFVAPTMERLYRRDVDGEWKEVAA